MTIVSQLKASIVTIAAATGGDKFKFLGDVPTAIAAWFKFLAVNGATLPARP